MTSSSGFFRHDHYASPWLATPQSQPTAETGSSAPLSSSSSKTAQNVAATGKKRKRLQRACVACHKAKRRCDGGLPCSNCDFSSRLCNYSDSQGKTVAPTKRTLKPSEAALLEEQQQHQSFAPHPMHLSHSPAPPHQISAPTMAPAHGSLYGSPSSTSSPSLSPRMDAQRPRVEPSLETRRELLLVFFSHLQPTSSVFDEISFLRDLSSNKVLRVLLYAMYAVSANYALEEHHKARLSNSAKYTKLVAEAGDGSRYIQEARRLLYREDQRSGQSMIDGSANLEVAQSLYLLAFFEFSHGHYFRASSYIHLSSKHVTGLNTLLDQSPRDSTEDDKARQLQQRNIKRLACLIGAMDVSMSMMNGKSMTMKAWEVEAAMDSSNLSLADEDEETVSMLHLLNVSFVLNSALELRQKSKTYPLDVTKQAAQCEDELQRWAQLLPRSLHFDDARLHHVEQVLNDRLSLSRSPNNQVSQMSKASAICWILMHTMAETTTLVLKEVNNSSDSESKKAACKNLVILLEKGNLGSLPRLFASLVVSVLYSVTCSVSDQHDSREWRQTWNSARKFANFVKLQESIESNMTIWWKKRNSSLSPRASINRISVPSPTSSLNGHRGGGGGAAAISPSLQSSTMKTSSHRSSLPSPPPNTTYHYLPPLISLGTSPLTLPPLRLGGVTTAEKPTRHFWDQSPRPLSVLTSTK